MSYHDRLEGSKAWSGEFEFAEGLTFEVKQEPHSYSVQLNITGSFDGRELNRIATQLLAIEKQVRKK